MDKRDRDVVFGRKSTGGTDDWLTPDTILDPVRNFNKANIGYDPCGHPASRVGPTFWTQPPEDGLLASWTGKGLVFVNPPYSRVDDWVRKTSHEFSEDPDPDVMDECILLIPVRTSNRWWHKHIVTCDSICFWKGRIRFLSTDPTKILNSAPFPSALVYWGSRVVDFRLEFSKYGWVVEP